MLQYFDFIFKIKKRNTQTNKERMI